MTEQDTRPAADRDLLRAFADRRDGEAFAELVRRHGPLVLGACRRVLGDRPDADDAFQATFLVLARKAGGVGRPDLLGNWLFGVAVRVARRARTAAARRGAMERPMTDVPAPRPDPDWADVRPVLDEEVAALPDKLRAALVLCELEGIDRAVAAVRLGVPAGTLSSRLARAKEHLRGRLARRGVALSAVGVGVVLGRAAPAAVPPGLTAAAVAAGTGAAGAGAAAAGLASHEVSAMYWVKALKVGLAAVVVAAAGAGGAVGYRQVAAAEDKKTDKDKFQGGWKVVSIKRGGQDHPNKDQVGEAMVFEGDKMSLDPYKAEFTLDPSKDPREVDFTLTESPNPNEKGQVSAAIYKLDGDKLIIHASHPGGERPTGFESKEGQTSMVFELERVKK